jgi:threonine dehydratase
MRASLKFNQKKNKLTDYFVLQSKTLDLKPAQS